MSLSFANSEAESRYSTGVVNAAKSSRFDSGLQPGNIATRSGWIRDPLGTNGVEKQLVVAVRFNVLQTIPATERVVGKVEHMIRYMVGKMFLELMQQHCRSDLAVESST